jgi:hypothetical protein
MMTSPEREPEASEPSRRGREATLLFDRKSVRARLMGIVVVAAVLTIVVGAAGLHGVASVSRARGADVRITDVQFALARIDADRNEIGAAVLEAVVAAQPDSGIAAKDPQQEFTAAASSLRVDFTGAVSQGLTGNLEAAIWAEWPQLANFVAQGHDVECHRRGEPQGPPHPGVEPSRTTRHCRGSLGPVRDRRDRQHRTAAAHRSRVDARAFHHPRAPGCRRDRGGDHRR